MRLLVGLKGRVVWWCLENWQMSHLKKTREPKPNLWGRRVRDSDWDRSAEDNTFRPIYSSDKQPFLFLNNFNRLPVPRSWKVQWDENDHCTNMVLGYLWVEIYGYERVWELRTCSTSYRLKQGWSSIFSESTTRRQESPATVIQWILEEIYEVTSFEWDIRWLQSIESKHL